MATRVGKVSELFALGDRGLVVVTDTSYDQLPHNLPIRVGDPIQVSEGGRVVLTSSVLGIEHCDPWTRRRLFAFLLPGDIRTNQIPIGSEISGLDPGDAGK
jgi:hypothetical protein